MECPIEQLESNRKIPNNCAECFAEKEGLCDFPYIGRTNVYDIIVEVYFKEHAGEFNNG